MRYKRDNLIEIFVDFTGLDLVEIEPNKSKLIRCDFDDGKPFRNTRRTHTQAHIQNKSLKQTNSEQIFRISEAIVINYVVDVAQLDMMNS